MNGSYTGQRFGFSGFATGITWAVRWLILVNAAVFAGQLVLAPLEVMTDGSARLLETFGFSAGGLFRGRLWQPFSYQFLHLGLMHLFMNMLWLFFFGPEVERLLGSRQFVRFYLACGALAVLLPMPFMVLFGQFPIMCGASGAVMGVLVAFAMTDPNRQFFLFPFPVPISAVGMVVLVFVMNLIAGLNGSMGEMTTHLGGMAAGYGLMKAIPLYYNWKRGRAREKMRRDKESREDDKVGEAVDNIFKFKDRK